jgi:hypothetical protein
VSLTIHRMAARKARMISPNGEDAPSSTGL